MRGRHLFHTPEDLAAPDPSDPKNIQLGCESDFDFFDVRLGYSEKEVIAKLGKPLMKVKNDSIIQGHLILLYKRGFKGHRSTTQIHVIHKRVSLIIEELAIQRIDLPLLQTISSLGLDNLYSMLIPNLQRVTRYSNDQVLKGQSAKGNNESIIVNVSDSPLVDLPEHANLLLTNSMNQYLFIEKDVMLRMKLGM